MRELFYFCRKYLFEEHKKRIIISSIFMFASATAVFFEPIIVANLVDYFTSNAYINDGPEFFIRNVVYFALALLIGKYAYQYGGYIGGDIIRLITPASFKRHVADDLLKKNIVDLQSRSTYKIAEILSANAQMCKDIAKYYYRHFYRHIFTIIGAGVLFLSVNSVLGVIFVVYFIVTMGLQLYTNRLIDIYYRPIVQKNENTTGGVLEGLANFQSIFHFGLAKGILKEIRKNEEVLFQTGKKAIFYARLKWVTFVTCVFIFHVGGFLYISYGIFYGLFDPGVIVLFVAFFPKLSETIEILSLLVEDFTKYKHQIERLNDLLSLRDIRTAGKTKRKYEEVSLKDVSFSYDDSEIILSNISLDIQQWEKVLILGWSGSGKSTLLQLLSGLHDSYGGEISFDGTSLKDISILSHVKKVVYTPQQLELFNKTIKENIYLASSRVSYNDLEKVCDLWFVKEFSMWADTLLNQKFSNISGGQAQRINLARVLTKRDVADIFLFDESFSALDEKTNEKVLKSTLRFLKDKTVIAVSHRKSDEKFFDRVIHIKKGKII